MSLIDEHAHLNSQIVEKFKGQLTETNTKWGGEIDMINKRNRNLASDIDTLKGLQSQQFELNAKIEALELKNIDLGNAFEEAKKFVHTSKHIVAEPNQSADFKNLEIQIRDVRITLGKKLDKFKAEVIDWQEKNKTDLLEARLIERNDEIVRTLTRELADRQDTKKNFKLVERQLKNQLQLIVHALKMTKLIPLSIVKEANKFKLYLQTEIISNYIQTGGDRQNTSDAENEFIVLGDDIQKLNS